VRPVEYNTRGVPGRQLVTYLRFYAFYCTFRVSCIGAVLRIGVTQIKTAMLFKLMTWGRMFRVSLFWGVETIYIKKGKEEKGEIRILLCNFIKLKCNSVTSVTFRVPRPSYDFKN
jgi:hypothetical protein